MGRAHHEHGLRDRVHHVHVRHDHLLYDHLHRGRGRHDLHVYENDKVGSRVNYLVLYYQFILLFPHYARGRHDLHDHQKYFFL